MPAETEKQKKTACIALAMKQGLMKKTPGTPAAEMAESMSEEDLREYCKREAKEK